MKDIKPSSPEVRNRDKATAIDPWDTAGPPAQRGESEFTDHERALLDAWDRTTALSPAHDAQFEARLLAALDGRLDAPALVHPASAHWIAERHDELTCAEMALDARSDGAAPTARPAGPIVLDLVGQRGRCRRPR
jgi:hypothetical protein